MESRSIAGERAQLLTEIAFDVVSIAILDYYAKKHNHCTGGRNTRWGLLILPL